MGVLDDAIREHLELKRRHGAAEEEISRQSAEALGPARRDAPGLDQDAERPGAVEDAPFGVEEEPFERAREAEIEETTVLADHASLYEPPEPGEEEATALQEPPAAEEEEEATALQKPPAAEEEEATALQEPPAAEEEDATALHELSEPEEEEAAVHEPPEDDDDRTALAEPEEREPEERARESEPEEPEEEEPGSGEDVLEETPDFLQETPEHDRLWFEQKPPRDFDFDE
jgi:hypothetical protein